MKRFEFRLDPVIRYRKYLEQIALMDLAKSKSALVQTEKRIKEMGQAHKDGARDLGFRETQGLDVGTHRIHTAYLQGLTDRIALENDRLVEIEKDIVEKQQAVEAQRIKKETLELIRQKEYDRYLIRIDKAQQKAADELVNLRRESMAL